MSFSIVIFQGPSASGKSTLQARLGVPKIVTWTSRQPRAGEQDGIDYHFATREQIELMFRQGLMLEMSEYRNNLYGTSISSIEDAGKDGWGDRVLLIGVVAEREQLAKRLFDRKVSIAEQEQRLLSYDQEKSALSACDLIIHNSEGQLRTAEKVIDFIREGITHSARQ